MSQAELCAAQQAMAGGFNDPYRGPYLAAMAAGSDAALLANCTGLGSPPLVVLSPPGVLAPTAAQAACAASGVAMPPLSNLCTQIYRTPTCGHGVPGCASLHTCSRRGFVCSPVFKYAPLAHQPCCCSAGRAASCPGANPAPCPAAAGCARPAPRHACGPQHRARHRGGAVGRPSCQPHLMHCPLHRCARGPPNPPLCLPSLSRHTGLGDRTIAARGVPPTSLLRRLPLRPPLVPACTPRRRRSLTTT